MLKKLLLISIVCAFFILSAGLLPVFTQEVPSGMLLIPGGKFEMGDESDGPIHTVEVSSFYMNIYELTSEDYCVFLNSMGNQTESIDSEGNPLKWIYTEEDVKEALKEAGLPDADIEKSLKYYGITGGPDAGTFKVKSGYENCPVVMVTWYGAVAYCNWLSENEGLQKCYGEKGDRGKVNIEANGYRLPTEAEWEYACRADSTTAYYWGKEMNGDYCWYNKNSGEIYHPAGEKKPNNFGLHDMSGNVWEWCGDWYGNYSSGDLNNPVGPDTGSYRVLRCGGFYNNPEHCRSASRYYFDPDSCDSALGFRLVRRP